MKCEMALPAHSGDMNWQADWIGNQRTASIMNGTARPSSAGSFNTAGVMSNAVRPSSARTVCLFFTLQGSLRCGSVMKLEMRSAAKFMDCSNCEWQSLLLQSKKLQNGVCGEPRCQAL